VHRVLTEVGSKVKAKALEAPYWLPRRHLKNWLRCNQERLSGRLLDFGCGEKRYEKFFLNISEYNGLEVFDKCEEALHKELAGVIYYDGLNTPFDDKSFDSIVSFQVLEHVKDIDTCFEELVRIGKDNCTYMITVPMFWPEHEAPYDFRRFTEFGIKSYLDRFDLHLDLLVKTGNLYEVIAVLFLDYLFTKKNRICKIMAIVLSPVVAALAIAAGFLDSGCNRLDRKCYLDLCLICRKRCVT